MPTIEVGKGIVRFTKASGVGGRPEWILGVAGKGAPGKRRYMELTLSKDEVWALFLLVEGEGGFTPVSARNPHLDREDERWITQRGTDCYEG